MQKHTSQSPTQTKNLAKKLAKDFKGGEILGLVGELGSGKTVFVKGLAQGLGIKQSITSPTFVLLKPYKIKFFGKKIYPEDPDVTSGDEGSRQKIKYLVHIDCYRLDNPNELLAIGIEEYLNNPHYLTVIEWAEKIKNILPKNTIWIKFKFPPKANQPLADGKKKNQRIITIIK